MFTQNFMNFPCLEVDFSNLFRADWNIEALSRVVIAYTAVKINASSALVPLLVRNCSKTNFN